MIGKRAIALILGLAAGVALMEAGLRVLAWAAPRPSPPTMRPVPNAGPILETWQPSEGALARILIVGDSFTVGRGVDLDETYAGRLSEAVGDAPHRAEVTSYSFPGWNARAEAASLTRDFERLAPDLLIVGHCLNDAEKFPTARATADRPELRPWQPDGPLETWLDRNSLLFSRSRRAVDAMRLRPLLRRYYQSLYEDQEGKELWLRSLATIRSLAEQRSIPAVLVIFPIFDSQPDEGYPYRNLHESIAREASAIGFEVLDLLPAYRELPGEDLALVPFTDPHPSALAHAVAGREIADFLERRGLLGSASR